MTSISAQQLIYTRVEADYSSKRKSGFQTVYRSNTLSSALVESIEERIQCFASKNPVTRLQFFRPDPNHVVLARTTVIEPNLEIVDSKGRVGTFLVHCLIFRKEHFIEINNNPFAIFDNYKGFLNDPREMVQRFGQATGIAESVTITITDVNANLEWDSRDLTSLISLGLTASTMKKEKQSVLFFGEASAIESTLRLVFLLLPNQSRLACSFDTFVENCIYPKGFYWAVGASRASRSEATTKIDTDKKQIVVGKLPDSLNSEGLYLNWLAKQLQERNIGFHLNYTQQIQNITNAFEDKKEIRYGTKAAQEFLDFYRELVDNHILLSIQSILDKQSAENLFSYINKEPMEVSLFEYLTVASTHTWNPQTLGDFTLNWILNSKPELEEHELANIRDIARESKNNRLLLLAAVYGKKTDDTARQEALKAMTPTAYTIVVRDYWINFAEPADLVIDSYVPLLLKQQYAAEMNEKQLIELVRKIVDEGMGKELAPLAREITGLESKELYQIEKIIKNNTSINPTFQKAVLNRRDTLGRPSFLDKLPF